MNKKVTLCHHDEKMAIGDWVMSWPKIYRLFQQILSIANPIHRLFQRMDSSNVCYSRHCHQTGICVLWLQNGQEWSGMFRNVRTKAKCGDTIPAGTTTEHVRNVRNIFRNVQSVRRGQRWRMCSCTTAGLNVTCWSIRVIFGWTASLAILRLHLLGYYIQHA